MRCVYILFLILLNLMLFFPDIYSADNSNVEAEILRSVSGINNDDIKAANSKTELTLFNAYAKAVYNTERLKISGESYFQASARKDQAFGAFLPYVSLQGMYVIPKSITSTAPASNNGSSTGVSVYARQNLFTGLNEWGSYKGADADLNHSRTLMLYNANLLLLDVSSAFYTILTLDHALKNNREILNLYTRMKDEQRRRVSLGKSRPSELLRIDSQVFQLEAQIKEAKNQLESAKLAFATLAGIDSSYELEDKHILPEIPDVSSRADEFAAKRADVKAAKEDLERADIKLTTALGGHLPNVYAQGAYSLLHRGNGIDYYAGVGVELPLFSGGIVSGKIKEAESQKRQAELALSNIRRVARQDIINAARSCETSRDEAEAFRKALNAAQSNYQSVTEDYRRDRVTILDVLTSLTLLQSAKNDFEKAEFKYRFNRIWLGVATSEFSGENIHLLNNKQKGD